MPGSMLAQLVQRVSQVLWAPSFWLPANVTWDDLKSTPDLPMPDFSDLLIYPIPLTACLLIFLKCVLEPKILAPLARDLGVDDRRPPPPPANTILEELYRRHNTKPPRQALWTASETTSLSVREVERWLRDQARSRRVTMFDLFLNCGSTLLFKVLSFGWGTIVAWNQPWLWNLSLCWKNYPHHAIDRNMWWCYMISLSCYSTVMLSETLWPRRKMDGQTKMVIHHYCTVALMSLAWACNYLRIGILILVVHECADIFLMLAKMSSYAHKKAASDVIFAVFMFIWVLTRCIIYPVWVMHSVFFEAPTLIVFMPVAYIFFSLITLLCILNFLWTHLIFSAVYRKFFVIGELREMFSSDEDEIQEKSSKKIE